MGAHVYDEMILLGLKLISDPDDEIRLQRLRSDLPDFIDVILPKAVRIYQERHTQGSADLYIHEYNKMRYLAQVKNVLAEYQIKKSLFWSTKIADIAISLDAKNLQPIPTPVISGEDVLTVLRSHFHSGEILKLPSCLRQALAGGIAYGDIELKNVYSTREIWSP